ncbi:SH3 domain-containing protein [Leptolyngbya sp. BL0902]|uniref:SH3 domain-containing protein n=1 Tax=Leptolyngbya sp. BL0902 TaxID=1115757 RepID=UPI0018E8E448|nr:SH3 domain-containing protein [Leptolyngbya sp. BL0902]
MKWLTFVLLLGLWTTACQRTPPVSVEPDNPEIAVTDPDVAEPTAEDPTTSPEPAPEPEPDPGNPIKTGTVRAEPSLRIHTTPGTNTPVIYAAPNGTRLDIFAETAMGDSTWYQVRSTLSPRLGWAYGGNIAVDGEGNLTSDRPPPPEPPPPDRPPPTDSLSMTCAGTLSNGTRFTVSYTREAGFSRFTLTPDSGDPLTANLAYSGKTDAQHGVWKGQLSESEVRVHHLSNQAAKPGDEVRVFYNIFDGSAVCR